MRMEREIGGRGRPVLGWLARAPEPAESSPASNTSNPQDDDSHETADQFEDAIEGSEDATDNPGQFEDAEEDGITPMLYDHSPVNRSDQMMTSNTSSPPEPSQVALMEFTRTAHRVRSQEREDHVRRWSAVASPPVAYAVPQSSQNYPTNGNGCPTVSPQVWSHEAWSDYPSNHTPVHMTQSFSYTPPAQPNITLPVGQDAVVNMTTVFVGGARQDQPRAFRAESPRAEGSANVAPVEEDVNKSNPIVYIGPFDVLFGRSSFAMKHEGNVWFRDICYKLGHDYATAKKGDPQRRIKMDVVRNIRSHQGRFLKEDEDTGMWYEVGDAKAMDKAGQILRDCKKIFIRDNLLR